MCVMYTKQGIMTAKEFGDSSYEGVSSMMGLVILLVLSFSIGGVIKGMGAGQFLASRWVTALTVPSARPSSS